MPETKKMPLRSEITAGDRWDLTPLFDNDEQWEALFATIAQKKERYAGFKGRLQQSADFLADALEFHMDLSRSLDNLYTYAHLKSDEDKTDSHYLGLQDRAVGLATQAAEMSSFIAPEVQGIESGRMEAFLKHDRLQVFHFYLQKLLRAKPHTHDEAIERILAMSMEMARAASQIFGQLDNADLTFGEITDENGDILELSHGNFISFLMRPQRAIRQQAFLQYYRTYRNHRHSIAAALSQSVKKDVFYASVRSHATCRGAALFPDNVPEAVYDNLVATVKANLPPLFRYLNFRRGMLGLERLHFYDTYVPLVAGTGFRLSYEQAVELTVAALRPLGDEYTTVLKQGLTGGWVDRYENKGKRSGAYSSGSYDSPPYILINFQADNINSLYTLVHEAGHSMHSYFSKKRQPYVNHEYTIFAAEVASTFNEVLLSRYLLDTYRRDTGMTAYILNREIDNIRATFFRQTMFAEFEQLLHREAEQQRPLTVDVITGMYHRLLETYFGEGLVIDPELDLECLRIPHFYHAFYVYKYATGLAAAVSLARGLLAGGAAERDAYLGFLGSGGSLFPLDALKEAGADMASPEPVVQTAAHFGDLVGRLIGLLTHSPQG